MMGARGLALGLALVVLAALPARGTQGISWVRLFDDGQSHLATASSDPALVTRSWAFCPADRMPCAPAELAWVQLGISIDLYSQRRNDPHDSIARILATSNQDVAPLATALSEHFQRRGVTSDAQRVAFVQGMVQGVLYEFDANTGWTDYPKFILEFLVDQQGDCDDTAITTTLLLQALGYESWFVLWDSADSGHLSTAITPDRGDLKDVEPPADSQWVEADGHRLLHVDATGAPTGCGQAWVNCGGLGFNEWYKQGMELVKVVRANDPDLEEKLPLTAWSNGGFKHPDRQFVDRRSSSDQAIRDELQRTTTEQLEQQQRRLAELAASSVVIKPGMSPWVVYSTLGFALLVFGAAMLRALNQRRLRRQRAAARRQEQERNRF